MDGKKLRVTRGVTIPHEELQLTFSPSGGPGGQHANRSATRVAVTWNVRDSAALGPRQRERVLENLKARIDGSGSIRLASSKHRSQLRNREDVLERLAALVAEALIPPNRRIATRPTRGAQQRRLAQKKRRGEVKKLRTRPSDE
ncbi:MAG TPA: alternative ribosome rescue aminoacyl-tRNA hydrolase ArfB [Actinomycetota bacterium]|nr:alternative ribosome rescue aminoacyl-tRNA hydrolase ArfB [Actinomycetota bacterium]